MPIKERYLCGHDRIMLKRTDPSMKTIYCLSCGQEWKNDEMVPGFRYVRDYEHWSSIIENEANKIARESGREVKVKFKVTEENIDTTGGGESGRKIGPKIDCDYHDYEALKFTIQAIRKYTSSMPIMERDTFSYIANMFEEWISRQQQK
ncbi:MAG: hypothetical protein JRN15_07390 [Nitrososphaerota archaeon]|nr:hypothetical protein [Nitrososphaerota archaeon]